MMSRKCFSFDTYSGTWNVSHNLNEGRAYHSQWWIGAGLWLLGGALSQNRGVKTAEFLFKNSNNSVSVDFGLEHTTRCIQNNMTNIVFNFVLQIFLCYWNGRIRCDNWRIR